MRGLAAALFSAASAIIFAAPAAGGLEPSQPPVYLHSSGTPSLMCEVVRGGDMVFVYVIRGGFYRADPTVL